jgi:hypothetical protein
MNNDELLKDLLVTALECGSNYRYVITDHNKQNGEYYHEVPFRSDGELFIQDRDEEIKPIKLTKDMLLNGFDLMRKEHPRHYQDATTENHDADTGDVLLQLSLFGKLVFG